MGGYDRGLIRKRGVAPQHSQGFMLVTVWGFGFRVQGLGFSLVAMC